MRVSARSSLARLARHQREVVQRCGPARAVVREREAALERHAGLVEAAVLAGEHPEHVVTCASACWSVARGDLGRERGGAVVLAGLVQREAEVGEDARAQAVVGARFERDRIARLRAVPLAAPLVDAAELVLDARDVVR